VESNGDYLFKDITTIRVSNSKNEVSNVRKFRYNEPSIVITSVGITFRFLEAEKLRLVNIGAEDIYSGNSKLILGFIWTLILRYQIQKGGGGNNQ
jgi:hypothetical protein